MAVNDKLHEVIIFMGGLLVSAVTVTAFAFTTFETKNNVSVLFSLIDKRLDSIEHKVDDLKK